MSELAVISGTTHGIGRVTARELAKAGRTVVMLCRDIPAAHGVREEILAAVQGAEVHVVPCDLASLKSVRECAATLRGEYGEISLLINNAAITSWRSRFSPDGFELTFATNHLGPFLLTQSLLDRLKPSSRIVNVASRAHFRGHLNLDSIRDPKARYSGIAAYAQSKLANILYTFALARRLAGSSITANCLHPGVVASNLLPRWLALVKPLLSPNIVDVERGARTSLYCALSREVAGVSGKYFDEHQTVQRASEEANDMQLQERLWHQSELWTQS